MSFSANVAPEAQSLYRFYMRRLMHYVTKGLEVDKGVNERHYLLVRGFICRLLQTKMDQRRGGTVSLLGTLLKNHRIGVFRALDFMTKIMLRGDMEITGKYRLPQVASRLAHTASIVSRPFPSVLTSILPGATFTNSKFYAFWCSGFEKDSVMHRRSPFPFAQIAWSKECGFSWFYGKSIWSHFAHCLYDFCSSIDSALLDLSKIYYNILQLKTTDGFISVEDYNISLCQHDILKVDEDTKGLAYSLKTRFYTLTADSHLSITDILTDYVSKLNSLFLDGLVMLNGHCFITYFCNPSYSD